MANTPFVKRMRTQSGTFYSFCSAVEDINLNISEKNAIVKMSHYALLNIPSIDVPDLNNFQQNRFNVFAINGAFQSFLTGGSIKDGRVIIAESFQNYALNLEANILSESTYNPALTTTISERVFWKWMKETGAIRWTPINTSAGTYWQEENDTDSSVGYNSIVKCIGTISAGSVRTDTFGTYNETYILVPTSFGQTPVYFKQVEDDNYYHTLAITNGATNILGRETYTQPHPDGLDFKAYYDLADSSTSVDGYNIQYDDSTGSWSANYGSWWTAENLPFSEHNSYLVDSSTYITTGAYNIRLQYYNGVSTIQVNRSKVDCLSIEFDLDNLKTIFNDPTLTFDKLAIENAIDDTFDFNAVLVYYSVYNKALDKVLATNLLGILFLDAPSGNTSGYPNVEITLPSITKIQSGASGFGTSYSFRLNIKSDYLLDDTQAIVTDTTASQQVLEDFSQVFDSLGKSITILNEQTGTINYIYEQYLDITANQTNILNKISDIEYQVNDISRDITGTENAIAMFAAGDDPIVDSSIYMKYGKIGFFTNNPTYSVEFDSSIKTKDIILENAVRDTSGNIILGYGSPLQIGTSTNAREVAIYAGQFNPAMYIDTLNRISFDSSVTFSSVVYFDGSIVDADGNYVTGGIGEAATKSYVDASLDRRDVYIDGSLLARDAISYIRDASVGVAGSGLSWSAGKLYVDVSVAAGGVTLAYVDGSIASLRANIGTDQDLFAYVNNLTWSFPTFAQFDLSLNKAFASNASLGYTSTLTLVENTSIGWLDASVKRIFPLSFASNTSIGTLSTNKADLASPTFSGTPLSTTNGNALDNTTQIATDQFVQNRVALADTNWRKTDTSLYAVDASVKSLWTKAGNIGNWTFGLSGNDLILKYNTTVLFKFTTDGSILAAGDIIETTAL